jgi:SAM-dependent methyltransferase
MRVQWTASPAREKRPRPSAIKFGPLETAPRTLSGKRAGQRFDLEVGVATEALLFLGELDPEAIGPSLEHATHYEPTPIADAERMLASAAVVPHESTFVDLGAGMGRVVILAARLPFRAVIGVEISPALAEIARDNLASAHDTLRVAGDVGIVRRDALEYAFPDGPLVVYLYNPFDEAIMAPVIAALAQRADGCTVLYHTPLERALFDAHPAFTLVDDLGFGLIYTRAANVASA